METVADEMGESKCTPMRYLEVEGFADEIMFFLPRLDDTSDRVCGASSGIAVVMLCRDGWGSHNSGWVALAGWSVLNVCDEGKKLGRDGNTRKEEHAGIIDAV